MKFLDLLEQAIEQRSLYGDEPIEGVELPDDLDELWRVRSEMKTIIDGARAMLGYVEDAIAYKVGDGAARMGDSVATVVSPMKRRVMRPAQFWDFLHTFLEPEDINRLFNPNQIRVGELKKLIEERGLDYDTVMATLFDESRDLPKLQVRPSHLSPKWQQSLPEGEVIERRKHD